MVLEDWEVQDWAWYWGAPFCYIFPNHMISGRECERVFMQHICAANLRILSCFTLAAMVWTDPWEQNTDGFITSYVSHLLRLFVTLSIKFATVNLMRCFEALLEDMHPSPHFNFRLLSSRCLQEGVCTVLNHQVSDNPLQQPWEADTSIRGQQLM